MSVLRGIFISFCMLWITAASASAATTKPSTSGQSNATIYFIRPVPVLGWATAPDIKFDGRLIGELSVGSYFTVSSPPGRHTIAVQGGLAGEYESELQVEAGKSYFIEIGPKPQNEAPGHQLLASFFAGNTGQRLPGRGFFGSYVFYLLDADAGRAKIATLKKIAR